MTANWGDPTVYFVPGPYSDTGSYRMFHDAEDWAAWRAAVLGEQGERVHISFRSYGDGRFTYPVIRRADGSIEEPPRGL